MLDQTFHVPIPKIQIPFVNNRILKRPSVLEFSSFEHPNFPNMHEAALPEITVSSAPPPYSANVSGTLSNIPEVILADEVPPTFPPPYSANPVENHLPYRSSGSLYTISPTRNCVVQHTRENARQRLGRQQHLHNFRIWLICFTVPFLLFIFTLIMWQIVKLVE